MVKKISFLKLFNVVAFLCGEGKRGCSILERMRADSEDFQDYIGEGVAASYRACETPEEKRDDEEALTRTEL